MLLRIMIIVVAFLTTQLGEAKDIHKIPFGSTGNVIEIAVENTSMYAAYDVTVKAVNLPSWVNMNHTEMQLDEVKPNGEKIATFAFSVDRSAPLDSEQTLTFELSTPSGEKWTKEIQVSVSQPERFELYQNFPNPFNPTTQIEYTVARAGNVKLIVYNTLGQVIQRLVDGIQDAGYKSVAFDAGNLPSGLYYYRLEAEDFTEIKKMILIK